MIDGEEPPKLDASTTSKTLSVLFDEQGISYQYMSEYGMILINGEDGLMALNISEYAVSGATPGTQDSELIAESIRYAALYPNGKNGVAVAVGGRFL